MHRRATPLLVLFHLTMAPANPVVLMIGDSSGEFAGTSLADFCAGATVVNRAISGTFATQWGTSGGTGCDPSTDTCCGADGGTCQASNAFSTTYGTGYSHVWIGLGGNDYLDAPGCGMSQAELETRITSVLTEVKGAASAAGYGAIPILATGYCQPIEAVGACASPNTRLNDAWASVASTDPQVTFVSSGSACGGGDASWSSGAYHVDNIHLNNRGYCKTWTMPAVQSALGCGAASYDCDGVNPISSEAQQVAAASAGNGGIASNAGGDTGGGGSSSDGGDGGMVEEDGNDGASVGTIVGAAMGGVVAIAVIVAVATFMLNSRRQGPGESPGRGATATAASGEATIQIDMKSSA